MLYSPRLFLQKSPLEMTSAYFDEAIDHDSQPEDDFEFWNPSPNNISAQSYASPRPSVQSQPRRVLAEVDSEHDEDNEDNEDGLYSDKTTTLDEGEEEDSSFGDGEHVNIASDLYRWKIDHSKGNHRLKGKARP